MITAQQALARLKHGNAKFMRGENMCTVSDITQHQHIENQTPFAIIIGCSDSRVPVEIVFNQDPGDLFTIRVAGNVVAPELIGSVEYAAQGLGTRLVVVLGHSHCGAVSATLDTLRDQESNLSENLQSITQRIRPAVMELFNNKDYSDEELSHKAVRANIAHSAKQLRENSEVLEKLIQNDELVIIEAEYSLATGEVEFLTDIETK